MKKFTFFIPVIMLLFFSTLFAEAITISEARQMDLGATVTVQGIVTVGGELGSIRYIQDETAGIAIYDAAGLADEAVTGDEITITGQLSEFNNLLQIVDEGIGDYSYEILSSENELPAPMELSLEQALTEDYESQLVSIVDVIFTETGIFSGNTNYEIDDGFTAGQIRVASATDIPGANIPEDVISIVGVVSQFMDTYQIMPRSLDDMGLEPVVVVNPDLVTIAEARQAMIGELVTVEGTVLNGSELGNIRYIQDETAGIAIYNPGIVSEAQRGDIVQVTGSLSEFQNLMQIIDEGVSFEFEIMSSGNDLPDPVDVELGLEDKEAYESQLVSYSPANFSDSGAFEGNTNYEVTNGTGSSQMRINNNSDLVGTNIPETVETAVGIMGQFQDTYQLLPRDKEDLGIETVIINPETISIAEARELGVGATVSIKGIVTVGTEFGNIRYMQDETAGIAIFNPATLSSVVRGDSLILTGEVGEFQGLMQIIETPAFEYSVINSDNEMPEPVVITLDGAGYDLDHEAELVQVVNVFYPAAGESFAGNTNYEINDGGTIQEIRIDADTDIPGTEIPGNDHTVVGVMSQFQGNFQLMPRDLEDLGLQGTVVEPGTVIPIGEARLKPIGSTVTVVGIVTNGEELGVIRYAEDETGGIGIYNPEGFELAATRGDSIKITGQISEFAGLREITDEGGDFSYTVLSSGNALPEPPVLSLTEGFQEDYEGRLIRFEGLQFTDIGGTFISSTNYDMTDGTDTYQMRVYPGTDIGDTPIPSASIGITGILGQYQTDYQLIPRGLADIDTIGAPPIMTGPLYQTNIGTESFTINFGTVNEGNTTILWGETPALEGGELFDPIYTTDHERDLDGLEPASLYYVQAQTISELGDTSVSLITPMMTASLSSGDIKVYFNTPVYHEVATIELATYLNETFDDTLKAYIDRAKYTIDMCMYGVDNNTGLGAALQDAVDRGVAVRVVADTDSGTGGDLSWIPSGVELLVRPDSGEVGGIQHNKFILFDTESDDPNDPLVWTGSTNFSQNQLLVDDNNIIILQDQSLARAYKIEFEEMMGGKFGADKANDTPKHFNLAGVPIELYFSPSDGTNSQLINTIESADDELYFAILAFTREDVALAISRQTTDPDYAFVAGVMDDITNAFEETYTILNNTIGAYVFDDSQTGIMHHKYAIIDANSLDSDPIVWTGSHNWSNTANSRNDENSLVIHDARIANLYYQEFVQRYIENGGTLLYDGMVFTEDLQGIHNEMKVYPNPVQNNLQVVYPGKTDDGLELSITDMQGRMVYNANLENGFSKDFSINLEGFSAGMYILRINDQVSKFYISK